MGNQDIINEDLARMIKGGFDDVGRQLRVHDKQLEAIDTHLGKIDGRLDRVDTRLCKMDGRLDRIELMAFGDYKRRIERLEKTRYLRTGSWQRNTESKNDKNPRKTEGFLLEHSFDNLNRLGILLRPWRKWCRVTKEPMENASKKQKTAVLLIVWILLLIGAWFAAPAFLQFVLKSQTYMAHSITQPQTADIDRVRARSAVANLQKNIADKKMKGDTDQIFDLYLELSARLESLGHNAKAYQYIAAVIAHDPQNKVALFRKASLYEVLTPASDALDAWRAAIERDPSNSASYDRLAGIIERALSDPQQANGIYVEGLVRGGNDVSLMRSYADFLERQGQKSTALLYWKAIAQREPNDENAKNHVR